MQELQQKINERCFDDFDCEEEEIIKKEIKEGCSGCKGCSSDNEKPKPTPKVLKNDKNLCPECGAKLRNEGGCVVCAGDEISDGCGWSKCS